MSKRTWHAGKPIKKPDYNPDATTKELLDAVSSLYNTTPHPSLNQIVAALPQYHLNPIKVRKLLITMGVYESSIADAVKRLYAEGKTIQEIMVELHLSQASVHSYLPYSKNIYKLDETHHGERSTNADRQQLYRNRKNAVVKLHENPCIDILWKVITLFAGYEFKTSKGLIFTYTVKGGEIFVNRKEKSITKATVEMAYLKAVEMNGVVSGPKKLGVFGASYLYPVLMRFEVIRKE
ncbi:MAG: hypothetical protein NC093_10335 [Alistipes sp.]|nr:hypothetical protein [Alistipes sp.]